MGRLWILRVKFSLNSKRERLCPVWLLLRLMRVVGCRIIRVWIIKLVPRLLITIYIIKIFHQGTIIKQTFFKTEDLLSTTNLVQLGQWDSVKEEITLLQDTLRQLLLEILLFLRHKTKLEETILNQKYQILVHIHKVWQTRIKNQD